MKYRCRPTLSILALLLVAIPVLLGCRAIVGTVMLGTTAVVGAVGLAGYSVYKGGEAVVSAADKAGTSVKNVITGAHESVVISKETFKTTSPYSVSALYGAAKQVLAYSGFTDVEGTQDTLEGVVRAKTAMNKDVVIRLKFAAENQTSVSIRIDSGTAKQAEHLYHEILGRL